MRFEPPLELRATYWVRKGDTAGLEQRTVTVRTLKELEDINASRVAELTPEVLKDRDEGFWRWTVSLSVQLALQHMEATGHLVDDGEEPG